MGPGRTHRPRSYGGRGRVVRPAGRAGRTRGGLERSGTLTRDTLEPMTSHTPGTRVPTAIDKVAEEWVDTLVDLSPITATYIGRNEANGRLDDLSPDGHARGIEATKRALAAL
ncbi:hypothetical protein ABE10_02870, partial [Bacillus toyonensis]|nr:hypothetical protein [Bacillus toyonensis]